MRLQRKEETVGDHYIDQRESRRAIQDCASNIRIKSQTK